MAKAVTTKRWIIFFATFIFWIGIGVIFLLQSYFYTVSFGREMDWIQQGPYRLSGYVIWGVLTYPLYHFYCIIENQNFSRFRTISTFGITAILIAPLHRLFSTIIEIGFKNYFFELDLVLSKIISERIIAIAGGTLDSLIIVSILLFVFTGIRKRKEIAIQHRSIKQFQHQLTQTRLESLQSQLQPHFLFNTLNGIITLISTAPLKAESMIVKLSHILRYSLEHSHSSESRVDEELSVIQDYLDIEKVRLGNRLTIELSINSETLSKSIPTLLLQPLVENAIQYGISPFMKPGKIRLSIDLLNDSLEIKVEDSGNGMKPNISHGVGLSNSIERLNTLYGKKFILNIDRSLLGGAMIYIQLPIKNDLG